VSPAERPMTIGSLSRRTGVPIKTHRTVPEIHDGRSRTFEVGGLGGFNRLPIEARF
jgi:hypothetical protein